MKLRPHQMNAVATIPRRGGTVTILAMGVGKTQLVAEGIVKSGLRNVVFDMPSVGLRGHVVFDEAHHVGDVMKAIRVVQKKYKVTLGR